jgi:hypothetical protein
MNAPALLIGGGFWLTVLMAWNHVPISPVYGVPLVGTVLGVAILVAERRRHRD